MLPEPVRDRCGTRRSDQLGAFIDGVVDTTLGHGEVGLTAPLAEALGEFRSFNYERIYLRPESVDQANAVIALLRALVEHFANHPTLLPDPHEHAPGSAESLHEAVTYVGGMTRFACRHHSSR